VKERDCVYLRARAPALPRRVGQLSERKFFALGGIALRDADWRELRDIWHGIPAESMSLSSDLTTLVRMNVVQPPRNPETVEVLLDTTWRIASSESARTEALDRKAATVATRLRRCRSHSDRGRSARRARAIVVDVAALPRWSWRPLGGGSACAAGATSEGVLEPRYRVHQALPDLERDPQATRPGPWGDDAHPGRDHRAGTRDQSAEGHVHSLELLAAPRRTRAGDSARGYACDR
jgi:hypothetical protein